MGNVGIVEGGVWDTENHYSGSLWLYDLLNTIESAFDSISGGRRKEREIQRSAVRQVRNARLYTLHPSWHLHADAAPLEGTLR